MRGGMGIMSSCTATLAGMLLPVGTSAVAQTHHYDTAELDHAVAGFLGQPAGSMGGAKAQLDPRLKLARCAAPLEFGWHGTPGRTLAISCPDSGGWRIFVAVSGPSQSSLEAQQAVKRGEMITLLIRGRGFSLQGRALARDQGAVGDWIRVELPNSPTPLRARIERPGLASLPAQ